MSSRYEDAYAEQGSYKRPRSRSPYGSGHWSSYEERGAGDAKRARQYDDVEHNREYAGHGAVASGRSPERDRRGWADLDADEKEREWQRYEREREWDRYYATRGGGAAAAAAATIDEGHRDQQMRSYRTYEDDMYNRFDEHSAENARASGTSAPSFNTVKHTSAKAAAMTDPMDSPIILPFKRYTQILRESGKEPATQASGPEATQVLFDKYQSYRKAFQRRAMDQFFHAHRHEKWFKEKYSNEEDDVRLRGERKKLGRQGKKRIWLDELRRGLLDNVSWDLHKDENASQTSFALTRFGDREPIDEKNESVSLSADPHQLLIRQIPVEIGREDIESILRDQPGFRYLALGEPHSMKRYGRIGVAVFEDVVQADLAAHLSQVSVAGQKLAFELTDRPAQAKLRIAPEFASTPARIREDLRQARELVAMLEEEDRTMLAEGEEQDDALRANASDEIEAHLHASRSGGGGGGGGGDDDDEEAIDASLSRKALDLHIDLLRQVYNCDYYSSTLCDFPEELARRAPKSLRRTLLENPTSVSNSSSNQDKGKLWASNVDTKHQLLMRPDDDLIGEFGGTNVQQMLLDLAAPYSRQDRDDDDEAEKHRCIVHVNENTECGKPFKAQIFVQKHVLNKHRQWFYDLHAEKIAEARSFNNYVRDPQRPMPPLPTAPSANEPSHGRHSSNAAAAATYYNVTAGYHGRSMNAGQMRMAGDDVAGSGSSLIRIGATTSAQPMRAPLPSVPRPLDPRAAMAPRSYQDLDAGGAAESTEIELEY